MVPLDDTLAKRNALVLMGAQALGGANPAIVISLGGLVGLSLAQDKSLATLPVSLLNLGLAAGSIPAAMLMQRAGRAERLPSRRAYRRRGRLPRARGRRGAHRLRVHAALRPVCAATFGAGLYAAFVQSYLSAAADSASDAFRGRAISWVMAGGIAAAIIGPQTVIWTRDLVPSAPFAGGFLGQAALALLSIPVLSALSTPPPASAPTGGGRPLGVILAQGCFVAAAVPGLVAYGLMSFVMTAAPLAMVACGHSVGTAALGIQWHILAMYGPSFVTGRLLDRFGKGAVTALGLGLIVAAAVIGLSGLSVAHFWIALVLLGIGWNFGFIGATALVTECYRPEERAKVQAANDFLVIGSVAAASFSSGGLLHSGGWEIVNWLVFPPVVAALALLAWRARARIAVA